MVGKPTGNPNGRPRVYDRAKVGQDLIEWCKKPGNLNLCGFSADYSIDPMLVIDWGSEDPEFGPFYREAKAVLGRKREAAVAAGELHAICYQKNAHVYDLYMKMENREEKRFDVQLAMKATQAASEGDIARYESIMAQLATLNNKKKKK
jgi:hypothetical protein